MKKINALFAKRIITECDMWQIGDKVVRIQPFSLLFVISSQEGREKTAKSREKTSVLHKKSREKTTKSREKIVALLADDGRLSAVALAERIGISAKAVEKHLAKLKADDTIERVGPAKGGYWRVV